MPGQVLAQTIACGADQAGQKEAEHADQYPAGHGVVPVRETRRHDDAVRAAAHLPEVTATHARALPAQPSQAGSFLATATFFRVTYFGRPSRPHGSGASPRISGCR